MTKPIPSDCNGLYGPPDYDPDGWNDCPDPDGCPGTPPDHGGHQQGKNNCYNYACNIRNDKFAQPGAGGNPPYVPTAFTCDEYEKAAVADGLQRLGTGPKGCDGDCTGANCHKVALAIAPHDFHWLRLDSNGRWSHKVGGSPATDEDSSGSKITNIRQADLKPYKLCSCFCVCKCHETITDWATAIKKLEEQIEALKKELKMDDAPSKAKNKKRAGTAATSGTRLEVTLDVFSGRTNPTWIEAPSTAARLRQKLRDLPPADHVNTTRLGYRGFLLTFYRPRHSMPLRYRVFNGRVLTHHPGGKLSYHSDAHGLERALRKLAQRRGFESVLEEMSPPA